MTIVTAQPPSGGFAKHNAGDLLAVADPWDRARQASRLADRLLETRRVVLDVRLAAVRELVEQRRVPKAAVGRHLGISGGRVGQLLAAPRTEADDGAGVA